MNAPPINVEYQYYFGFFCSALIFIQIRAQILDYHQQIPNGLLGVTLASILEQKFLTEAI
jgi:hypothetical protein